MSWDIYGVQSFFENICVFIVVLGPHRRKEGGRERLDLGTTRLFLAVLSLGKPHCPGAGHSLPHHRGSCLVMKSVCRSEACRASELSLQFARCGYVIILMAVYWCTDVIPVAVTSLLPVLLFPLLKILDSKQVSKPSRGWCLPGPPMYFPPSLSPSELPRPRDSYRSPEVDP